jgi:tellurite resistance protein TehA-like permease
MGTGIVSVALLLDGERTLSRGLMWISLALWVALAVGAAAHATTRRADLAAQLRIPASLTGVAGTCVLGARLGLYGWDWAAAAMLVIAALLWALLVPGILGSWMTPAAGAGFLLAVSILALGGLAELLGEDLSASWLVFAGALLFVLGLAAYSFVASSFDLGQLLSGRGDQWIAGGALAIGGLTIAQLISSSRALDVLGSLDGTLSTAGWVIWGAAMAWLPFLIASELIRPRLGFDVRRWATVFPVGMYAAMSFALGRVLDSRALTDFARVWVWVAVLVWILVALGTLGHAGARWAWLRHRVAPTSGR